MQHYTLNEHVVQTHQKPVIIKSSDSNSFGNRNTSTAFDRNSNPRIIRTRFDTVRSLIYASALMVPHRIRGPDLCSLSAICSSDRTKADPKAPSGALGRSAVQEMSAVTAVARLNRLIEHRNLSTLPN